MTAVRVCSLADLTDRVPVAFQVGDEQVPVVLVRQGDAVHALRDECSHAAISL
ncbi:Rieske (2Fe-2S) protein, partial [Actinosynnema sp.]